MTIVSCNAFIVREFRPHQKNTLVGFLVLELPSGLVIRDVMLHEKGDSRWVSMPAKEYTKNGERRISKLIGQSVSAGLQPRQVRSAVKLYASFLPAFFTRWRIRITTSATG
jgi:hypothetical protein